MKKFEYTFKDFLNKMDMPLKNFNENDKNFYASQNEENFSFSGTNNFNESINLLKNGLRQEKLDVSDFLKDLNFCSTENLMNLSYEGFQVDFSEYAQGNPECMINLLETYQESKNLEINVSCVFAYFIEKETINNYGKMILGLIETLQSKNIDCKVKAIVQIKPRNGIVHSFEVLIKELNEVYDSDRLTYVISHASFLRRNIFKLMELEISLKERKVNFINYGSCNPKMEIMKNENTINIDAPKENEKKDYFLNQLKDILKNYNN
jgi:hypothetical protein